MMFGELPTPIQKILDRVGRRFEKEQTLYPAVYAVTVDGQIVDFIIRDMKEMTNAIRDRMEEKLIVAAQVGAQFVAAACEAWGLNLENASEAFIKDAVEMSKRQKLKDHDQRVELLSVMAESLEMHYCITAPIRRLAFTRPRLGPWTIQAVTKQDSLLPPGDDPPRFNFIYEKAYGGRIYR